MQLGASDIAVLHDEVLLVAAKPVFNPHALEVEILNRDQALRLPEKAVVLSPILELRPHNVRFEEPVLLIFPVCVGSTKAWRSLEGGGWEELRDVGFLAGHVVLRLDHFCQVFVGTDEPPKAQIKISCYMNDGLDHIWAAKWAITQTGCCRCKQMLADCFRDEEVLQDYKLCQWTVPAGTFAQGDSLKISWPDCPDYTDPEPGNVNFERFPLVAPMPWLGQQPSVELRIEDAKVYFRKFCALALFSCRSAAKCPAPIIPPKL